jgi:alpha-2-macroglobulin
MRARSLSRFLAATAAGLLSVSLVMALVGVKTSSEDPGAPRASMTEKPAAIVPLFGTTEPAANKPVLVLLPDERGLHGWIAGNVDAKGAKVNIKAGGTSVATIGDDNTFVWEQTTNKNLPATASLVVGGKTLTAHTTLLPAPPAGGPSIFFVTDRSAYRPGHTLKFVAFLRTLLPNGEFEPVTNCNLTVDLTSNTKHTRASRMNLAADAQGRITGEYTFSDADALDHYTLTAEGFTGSTQIFLGEYRKTKVGLKLKGEVKDGKLVVSFDARDYLDRAVKGTAATFTATVTRVAEPEKLTLNPELFVKPEGGPPVIEDFEALPDDERLVTMANGVSAMTFAGFGSRFVGSREGTVPIGEDGSAKLTLDLQPEWLKGHYTITVNGVFTDDTGRENRGVGTFKLDPKPTAGVKVSTTKELFATGEKIPVSLAPFGLKADEKTATTLIVVRLDAQPASPWVTPEPDASGEILPDNTRLPAIGEPKPAPKKEADGWKNAPVFDPVKRRIVSATPIVDATDIELKQPGAYKLLAVTRMPDGTAYQSEIGIVVKAPAKLPGVLLNLDKREIDSGTRLTGTVHTRFAGAKLLLTLRDSQGIKLAKPLTADARGVARIDEALTANLRYGCAVCVQYPESATVVHADQRDLFVIPTDRTIKVTTTVPGEVGPGAEVKLGVQIDRKEEVDLIVSVFDESLLGVAGDLSKDIRNFYLADGRGQARAARDLAATRVGAVTVDELVKKAEKLLADKERLAREPGLEPQLTGLIKRWGGGKLAVADVVTLVRLTGLEVYLAQYLSYEVPVWRVPKSATLTDLLRWERKDTLNDYQKLYISATVIGNVALIGVANRPSGKDTSGKDLDPLDVPDPWIGHRGNPYGYGYGFGFVSPTPGFCGGFQCTGFGITGISGFGAQLGQFGNLGQQFGIGGFQSHLYPNFNGGIGGISMMGIGGIGGISGGIGGIGGIGGGFGAVPSVAGIQGGFSYQPVVGGQMGMSFGFNRDFGQQGGFGPGAVALPGLGLGDEVIRRDFADSAYWSANLRTDKTGKANASFKLPDSLTNWRVQVTAVSPKMHIGTGTAKFKSTRSVMIWPMLPRSFTEGDVVRVFGTVHNMTAKEQTIAVHLKTENGEVLGVTEQSVKVPANGSVPVYWNYKAGAKGFTDLLMSAKCDAGSDASLKKLPVTAAGILERATASGLVGKEELKLTLPDDFDPARATCTVTIAPTLAADLADTLPYLVEYPYGCVEQTMSRFLPALRVAQILRQNGGSTIKELEEKLPKVVLAGQKRLIELQQPDGGWGWNGNSATHEMMTPYALLGLLLAEDAGYPCPNPTSIPRGMERLRVYLERMGDAWLPGKDGPPKFAEPQQVNDSLFCLWVYSMKADAKEFEGWWGRIEMGVGNPVMSDIGHAFALELAVKFKKNELAKKLVAELHKRAKKSGDHVYWTTAGFSRWGDNTTEVTAAVMKALVAHDPSDPLIPGILAFFHGTKRGDRWDSTKDTACVLYALCDYLAAVKAGPAAAGLVKINLNGTDDGNVRLDSPTSKIVKLTGKTLKPGENVFKVTGADGTGGALARVVVSFTRGRDAEIPARDHGVRVDRTISLRGADGKWTELKSGATVPAGSYVKVAVRATPSPGTQVNYTLLESPKPAGGETIAANDTRFAKDVASSGYVLREDREAMTCFHYEHAAGVFAAEYVVLTEFVGEFRIAPARVELMYKPTVGGHSDSFVLKVTEKK